MSTFTEAAIWLILSVLIFLAVRVNQVIKAMFTPPPMMDDPTPGMGGANDQGQSIFDSVGKKDDTDMYGNVD